MATQCKDCDELGGLLEGERRRARVTNENAHFWRHVAGVLAGGDEAKLKAAQEKVYAAFDGRDWVGPKMPNADKAHNACYDK